MAALFSIGLKFYLRLPEISTMIMFVGKKSIDGQFFSHFLFDGNNSLVLSNLNVLKNLVLCSQRKIPVYISLGGHTYLLDELR